MTKRFCVASRLLGGTDMNYINRRLLCLFIIICSTRQAFELEPRMRISTLPDGSFFSSNVSLPFPCSLADQRSRDSMWNRESHAL